MVNEFVLYMILVIVIMFIIKLMNKNQDLKSNMKSKGVKFGKSFEQLFPFMNNFPYDKNRFKFLGQPIDGILFNDDKIIFIEFKTGQSQLNDNQKLVKNLVEKKEVYFEEIRA